MHERDELTLQQLIDELAAQLPARELLGATMAPRGGALPWDPRPGYRNWDYGQPVFYGRR